MCGSLTVAAAPASTEHEISGASRPRHAIERFKLAAGIQERLTGETAHKRVQFRVRVVGEHAVALASCLTPRSVNLRALDDFNHFESLSHWLAIQITR